MKETGNFKKYMMAQSLHIFKFDDNVYRFTNYDENYPSLEIIEEK
jgi:hypothetical protein